MQRYLLLITALITIGLTSLVSIPGSPYLIGGKTQADISNMFSTSITPAGITFSIWSVIYILWIVAWVYFAFWQKPRKTLDTKSLVLFSLAILLTFVWLIPWGNLWIGVALLVMLVILALLAYTFALTRTAPVVVRSSIEMTLAWIMMATALNLTVYMRYLDLPYGVPGDFSYPIFALGVLLIVVSWLQQRYRSFIISGVFLWTLLGISIAHTLVEERITISIYTLITVLSLAYSYYKKR